MLINTKKVRKKNDNKDVINSKIRSAKLRQLRICIVLLKLSFRPSLLISASLHFYLFSFLSLSLSLLNSISFHFCLSSFLSLLIAISLLLCNSFPLCFCLFHLFFISSLSLSLFISLCLSLHISACWPRTSM